MRAIATIIACAAMCGCAIIKVEHNVTVEVQDCDVEVKGVERD